MSAVLGYESLRDGAAPERVWLDAPGSHRLSLVCKDELLAALHDLTPRLLRMGTVRIEPNQRVEGGDCGFPVRRIEGGFAPQTSVRAPRFQRRVIGKSIVRKGLEEGAKPSIQ